VPDNLPRVLVDKDKIQIALLNVIINAIEAMTPGEGILTIKATVHEATTTIEISDNGKGIAASDLKRLFDPFFTGKQTGMGLGLTSTKNILNSHNAQIDVASELFKGTTFQIHFKMPQ
jgi:signal transduction histidine kinase